MEKQAEVKIQLDPQIIDNIIKSLNPELRRKNLRTEIELSSSPTKDELKLVVKADDVNALRAALNSYLRWIKCIIEINRELSLEGETIGRT